MLESGRSRWLRCLLIPAAALLFTLLMTSPAKAYTWMLKHGYNACIVCHADPSGGELLTQYGRDMSENFLSTKWGEDTGENKFTQFMFGAFELPEPLLLGGSVRGAWTVKEGDVRVFPMQLDAYGQLSFGSFRAAASIGAARVDTGSPHARAAQVTTNQGKEFNLLSRTHWLAYDFETEPLTLRAGRMNLPFGIRIPEHVMWVRQETRTDRESDQQHGVALAYNGEKIRGEIMGIAGNYQINPDEYRERGYSLYLEYMTSAHAGIGVSSLVTKAARDRLLLEEDMLRMSHGAYVRAALAEPVVLLFEADLLKRSRAELGYVGLAQLDIEPTQGLHFIATGELLDQGYPEDGGPDGAPRTTGSGKPRLGGWASVNWFIYSHFDVRVDAIARKDDPFTLLGQLHLYL